MMQQHMLGPSTSLGGNNNSALQSSVLSDGVLLSHSQPTREEIKKSFVAEDGVYRIVQSAELSRPRPLPHYQMAPGLGAAANQIAFAGSTVRVSFLNAATNSAGTPDTAAGSSSFYEKKELNGSPTRLEDNEDAADIICFNVGKELYVYAYRGTQTDTDLSRPIDKRVYKGTSPTYHIFNQETSGTGTCQLVIGFTLGQLQIIDPLDKTTPVPTSKLYNEDRYIDKTSVTCIRFLPGDSNIFLASHVSGNLYVYDERVSASSSSSNGSSQPPPWIVQNEGEKYTTYGWKSKNPRNPVTRWQIGEGSIHQFNFSGPDAKMMATVSHDGFLRVFMYETQELIAVMKSYFGGLLTLAWSPDAKLIATGGEDDLLTVYSVVQKKVVCRGQAHKSWISQVQFDPYVVRRSKKDSESNGIAPTTTLDDVSREVTMRSGPSSSGEPSYGIPKAVSTLSKSSLASSNTINGTQKGDEIVYRIGSVGHDTFLCLWDITNDMLNQSNHRRHRNSTIIAPPIGLDCPSNQMMGRLEDLPEISPGGAGGSSTASDSQHNTLTQNQSAPQEKPKKKRFNRKAFGLSKFTSGGSSNASSSGQRTNTLSGAGTSSDGTRRNTPGITSQISCCKETRLLGSTFCPGIRDVPIIEPLTCKKVSHDRLTVLEFRKDCVVTACQEGFICTWSRPSDKDDMKQEGVNSTAAATPESEQKPSVSATASSYGYGSEMSNGIPPSRSSSAYSNHELQQLRSPNATSPSYRVAAASTSAYHRPTYAWQNAN
ncbi:hypothetical protein CRE_30709 [Caenorhabditis remanei]|uniref:Uncharacterized protein n=1 Tax=Caenorhabditis remanei TaxID=31234 RepID=E3LTV4_CAERE|nr:hypothetical protein CRE_30709 [Caenorhabditis remanei]